MAARIKVFLDTSTLFAGIWSTEGGARMVLKLGEAGAIQLYISRQVLSEIEKNIRAKAPQVLGALALILDRSQVELVEHPDQVVLQKAGQLVNHPGDALIVASAGDSRIDYFITLDRKHFLDNEMLRKAMPFLMDTPGDFLAWIKARFRS